MRMILVKYLRELGFETAEAADGRQALEQLYSGEQFGLALVDWNMPVMDGYEFLRTVRANALLGDIRIMMVTTQISMANVRQALAAGADEYLMKPFTKELLLEKLALLGLN